MFMKQRPLRAGTDATARGIRVGSTKAANRGWLGRTAGQACRNQRSIGVAGIGANDAARINAVAEEAHDAEQFVVTEAGVGSGLEDQIGSLVGGVAVGVESVVQTAAGARSVDEEVAGRGSGGARSNDGRRSSSIVNRGYGREAAAADGGLRS